MSRIDILRIVPLFIMLLVSIYLSLGLYSRGKLDHIDRINNGKIIADFELPSLGDGSVFSPKYFGKRTVVISVFASWCKPCIKDHKQLMKLSKIVNIYGIAWKDKPEDTLKFINKYGNPFQKIGIDIQGKTTVPMFLSGVPETFILDKQGKIALHYKDVITDDVLTTLIVPMIRKLNSDK